MRWLWRSLNITDTTETVLGDFVYCLKNFGVIFDPDSWRLLGVFAGGILRIST